MGMKFETMADVYAWREREAQRRHLSWEAHNLCNTLCDKLYNWYPEPERAARLTRVLAKARTRLARREREEGTGMSVDDSDYLTLHRKWRAACEEGQAERDANVDLRARVATLEAALNDQIELWQMARDTMNIADARMHRVKFMEFHDPIKAARAALEGTH
jgi:hypothetical protein